MSRTSLHRPRRPRVVWDRPATGTRLFTCPFPPNIPLHSNIPLHFPHYKRCPKAHRLRLRSDQSLSSQVHVTRHGRFPDKNRHRPFQEPMPSARCTHPAHHLRPLGRRPRARRQVAHQGHCAQRLHPRSLRRGHATQRRQRVHAPISPYGRALLVVETAPHRDSLASPPRPLRSTGLSQSRRQCGTSAVADNTHRYRRRRLTAQPSGTFHPLPLQFSPSFLRRQESIPGRAGAPLLGAYPPLPLPFSPSFLRRQESIPGRAGAPLLRTYPPLPLSPPCPPPN